MALCMAAPAIAGQDLRLQGTIETAFVSAKRSGELKSGHRYTRTQLSAEQGPWRAEASWWAYPYCDFHTLDETSLQFNGAYWSATAGRFRLPVGQHSWDDQWYSPFIFLARLELQTYEGGKRLSHTSPGYLFEYWQGMDQFQLGLTTSQAQPSSLLPKTVNRAALRWQKFAAPFIVGISAFVDPSDIGNQETMMALDARWSQPNWLARAVFLSRRNDGSTFTDYDGTIISTAGHQESLFIDTTYRPPGVTNLQLGLRWDLWRSISSDSQSETMTLGIQYGLGSGIDAAVNYTFGPNKSDQKFGGGWAFQVLKFHRF